MAIEPTSRVKKAAVLMVFNGRVHLFDLTLYIFFSPLYVFYVMQFDFFMKARWDSANTPENTLALEFGIRQERVFLLATFVVGGNRSKVLRRRTTNRAGSAHELRHNIVIPFIYVNYLHALA
jgi:hypothetical protein